EADRIDQNRRDDRDRVRQLFETENTCHRADRDDLGLETKQLFCKPRRARQIPIGVAGLEDPVLAFDVSELAHALQEAIEVAPDARLRAAEQAGYQRPRRVALLRALRAATLLPRLQRA